MKHSDSAAKPGLWWHSWLEIQLPQKLWCWHQFEIHAQGQKARKATALFRNDTCRMRENRWKSKPRQNHPVLAAVFPNPQSQSPRSFRNNECTLPRHRTIIASLGEHSAGDKWATNKHKRIQLSSSQWNETNLNARRVNKGTRQIPFIKTHCLRAKHSIKR